ncbi:MAG: DUF3604 domain-containing protein [Gammaproteobacteria bacterium]|nr:DUF3604 domain-containing protein [Gammaproteobacteria bacterium]
MTKIHARGALIALLALAPAANAETILLWGDTHLHTSHSTDSYGTGNTLIDPEQAYRYAKGMPVLHPTLRTRIRITRPLDFLVVADHSDFLGLQIFAQRDDPRLTGTEVGRRLHAIARENPSVFFRLLFSPNPEISQDAMLEAYRPLMVQPWLDEIDAAERHNEPGRFTAFAGWEWTSHRDNRNLHRVIFSAAPAESLRAFFPYSSLDSTVPEDLWAWLDRTSAATGADFIAIPHNANMSTGLMFDLIDSSGRPIDAAYARTRMRWEPVLEITQVKGTSEVHPALSPNDEFAEFEVFRRLFFNQEPKPLEGDYARSALLRGLAIEGRAGVNPYKFGMIGGSDIHTGLTSTEETDFLGVSANDLLPQTRATADQQPRPPEARATMAAWELSASGLAGVWASANTREAIAQAFQRKEVYATSGPRIALRVFAGYGFRARDAGVADIATIGYARGVPMGGDLATTSGQRAPSLLIRAQKDPQGANLDRIQVIKGWLDAAGRTHERIFDAAWAGARLHGDDGRLPPVGDTVDPASASYRNTIGAVQLAALWTDPEFDPKQRAFYYVRVLEIPTPRHQVHDAVALGMDPATTRQPLRIQERAWSSPIWYTPSPR